MLEFVLVVEVLMSEQIEVSLDFVLVVRFVWTIV